MKLEKQCRRPASKEDTNLSALKPAAAFTFTDLLIAVFCLAAASTFLFPQFRRPRCSCRLNCVNNLKQVGLSFRTWALDNYDRYPAFVSVTNGGTMELVQSGVAYIHFEALSNELSTPKVLYCPVDNSSTSGTYFGGGFSGKNLSYFVGVDAADTNPSMFLAGDDNLLVNGSAAKRGMLNLTTNSAIAWSQSRHQFVGNVGLADGSVQQFNSKRLAEALANTGSATNRLLMP